MVKRFRHTGFVLLVQIGLSCALVLFTGSAFVAVLAAVASLLAVAQCLKVAIQNNGDNQARGSQLKTQNSLLFPAFLLDHPLPVNIGLALLALSPLLVCLASGEPFGQTYPDSDHHNLVDLVTNSLGMITLAAIFALQRRTDDLRAFIKSRHRFEHLLQAIFLDMSLVNIAGYYLSRTNSYASVPYPLHDLSILFSCLWLFVVVYLGLSAVACLGLFILDNRKKRHGRLFRELDLLLMEPALLYCFSLGILSDSKSLGFTVFLVLSPIAVFSLVMFVDLLGIRQRALSLPSSPIPLRICIGFGNLFIYAGIVAFKLEVLYMLIFVLLFGGWLSAVFAAGYYRQWRTRRALLQKIEALNRFDDPQRPALSAAWFDEKVRVFNRLRSR